MESGKRADGYEDNDRFCSIDGHTLIQRVTDSPIPVGESEGKQPDLMIGRILAGRYRLLAKLGCGGMGVVYKGQHIKMNRLTAIKMLNSDLSSNPDFVVRFIREAEIVSHLNHPNVVAIYDFGEAEDGIIYLAMEMLEGQQLSDVIIQEGPLSLDRVVNIIGQSASALDAAHKLGLIHRDFKPDNVIICKTAGNGDWVKVVDFGLAKWARVDPENEPLTPRGLVLGTPEYMSPEQVSGKELDLRSDIYNLALVAYEMIAGVHPFQGSRPLRRMVNRLLEPPLPFRLVRPQLDVPVAVEQVVTKALARNPDERYPSVLEFASELRAAARSGTFYQRRSMHTQPLTASSGGAAGDTNMAGQAGITSSLDQGMGGEAERSRPEPVGNWRRLAKVFTPALVLVTIAILAATFFYNQTPSKPALMGDTSQGETAPVDPQGEPKAAEAGVKSDKQSGEVGSPDRTAREPIRPEQGEKKSSPYSPVQKAEIPAAEQKSGGQPAETNLVVGGKTSAGSRTEERTPEVSAASIGEDHMKRGLSLLRAGSYAQAIVEFLAVERLQPANQDVHYMAGLAYEKLGRRADALAAYEKCESGPYASVASQHVKRLSKKVGKKKD
ncbi:MAG TPA: protein kinase [Blastocatellia bacterium]|nr:protein kinase [Blastocatellia bacterium]